MALAYKAGEVMLVHGDSGARHSLATALRRRQVVVTTPRVGTSRSFTFKKRPWAIAGQVKQGSHTDDDVKLFELWASLKSQAGNFYNSRELAQAWWGNGDRAKEMQTALDTPDNIYFSADWRNKTTYRIQSDEQVKRAQRRRAIMLANPDIVGKLIVMRNSNNQPRLGVVKGADIDSFDADVHNAQWQSFSSRCTAVGDR